ncbi:uncharacterized protein LOC109800754 [Cajanus cajan]|uniref:Formin-like protein 18 n=1 Tax=Cajanus cajan TaxID=3821 RepID=A0A151TK29_CAJCA|nr:uncharacterized protein LOC109800754 [Cajanus cajan]KYP67398.1 hypothetical protein KK1_013726 [Cajanus cajan]
MDPCPFVRILVGNLAVKSPASSKASSYSGKVHPSSSPFFCRIKLKGVASDTARCHVATLPLISERDPNPHSLAASFDFSKPQIMKASKKAHIKISVYKGPTTPTCFFTSAKLMGCITIPLDLASAQSRPCTIHNGWASLSKAQLLHLTVRAEPDPRFVFRFDGEPECSPQVFQVKGHVKQPVFTCKFSFRDKNPVQFPTLNANRKGWSITVHDLSGSPVAAASMVTPFVPSPGSQRVSRSNPGAWLIIRPDGDGTWKPWGRLEAWREPNHSNAAVGYRFEVLPATADPVTLAASTLSSQRGGKFTIDATSGVTPANTPNGSWDLGSGSMSSSDFGFESQFFYKGFVMSATVNGEGKCSKPEVEVGVQHVTCTEDAAAFVALAAALDLSIDACKLFSQKLRKELRQ